MLITFPEIIDEVLTTEGGYVNDPDDPGGETKYGISKKQFPNEDIKNLTRGRAIELYKIKYWDKFNLDSFPDKYKHLIFDMYVNHSDRGVAKILQRSVNNKAQKEVLVVDGKFGKLSRMYFKKYSPEINRILAFRAKYYNDVLRKNPKQKKHYYGWILNRVFDFYI